VLLFGLGFLWVVCSVSFSGGLFLGFGICIFRIAILLLLQMAGMVGLVDVVYWRWCCISSIAIRVYFWGWLLDGFLCL
jgi:hypothetical protein